MTSFTVTWNATYEGLPADSEDAKDGASRIRSFKLAFRERAAVDHFIAGDAHDGKHKKISLRDFGGDPTLETDDVGIYTKAEGGYLSLYFKDKAGNVVPLTRNLGGAPPTGSVFSYVGTTAPVGYVLLSGRTIGNGSSGGTERANADTEALFTLLWNSLADAEAPVSGGRGASAAADFAANKNITLPDARGRVIAGWDNMTGSSANRLTNQSGGVDGDVMGKAGGAEQHTLLTAEVPSHTHTLSGSGNFQRDGGTGRDQAVGDNNAHSEAVTLSSVGGGGAHNNVQPTLVLNSIIKL